MASLVYSQSHTKLDQNRKKTFYGQMDGQTRVSVYYVDGQKINNSLVLQCVFVHYSEMTWILKITKKTC